MQSKLSIFLNKIFKYLVFFCLFFVWFSYYLRGFVLIVCVSAIFSGIACFLLTMLFYKKTNKKNLNANEQKQILDISRQLLFYNKNELLDYFFNVFKSNGFSVVKTEIGLELTKNQNKFLYVPAYHKMKIDEELLVSLLKIANMNDYYKIIISAISFSEEAKNLNSILQDKKIILLNESETYLQIIKLSNIIPTEKIKYVTQNKLKWKEILNVALSREKAKGYFISGFILLFASYFVHFGLYYVISSSVLLILSLFSFYNHKYNLPKKGLFE